MRCFYNDDMWDTESAPDRRGDREYTPISPCSDSVQLAQSGRLILKHNGHDHYPYFVWREAGDYSVSGWVVGIEVKR
jgi:hypothetical protein